MASKSKARCVYVLHTSIPNTDQSIKKIIGPNSTSTLIVRLISTAQTGFFYTTQRLRTGPKLAAVKYDPQGTCSMHIGPPFFPVCSVSPKIKFSVCVWLCLIHPSIPPPSPPHVRVSSSSSSSVRSAHSLICLLFFWKGECRACVLACLREGWGWHGEVSIAHRPFQSDHLSAEQLFVTCLLTCLRVCLYIYTYTRSKRIDLNLFPQ